MKYLNKLTFAFLAAFSALTAMTSCEGSDMYTVGSPDWLQEKIDSIAAANKDRNDDIYQIGATDYSSGWWADFSHYYIIPDGAKWTETFNLHINPAATNTYKNFALILTNDVERGGDGYKEYGAIRFDTQPSGNSEWGTIDRSCIESNLVFETDTDPGIELLGGLVTLVVDRSPENAFNVTMSNENVTKTYKLPRALDNLNADSSNENIRAFLVVEGSYIDFLTCNIDQIRTTKTPDQQPVSMVLNYVPKKVLVDTPLKTAFENVTATVTYSDGGERIIPASSLTFVSAPDFETLGEKTIVAIYNKTYKDQNADQPITATVTTKVVETLSDYVCVGNPDKTTGFWGAHSENVYIAPGSTYVSQFTNYSTTIENYHNFCVVLNAANVATEYAVVRADDFGWGDGYASCTHSRSESDWGVWRNAMDGAKVTLYITNNGNGTADIEMVMIGSDDEIYLQDYKGITVNSDDLYFRLTVDHSYIEFNEMVGLDDNTTPFWGAHSANIQIKPGMTLTQQFINYTTTVENWNNFCVILNAADIVTEYAVVRADDFGWGAGYGSCTHSRSDSDWGVWRAAMDGAKVTCNITNNGNGTADVDLVMVGSDGNTYTQNYRGITVNSDDLFTRLTVDNSHLIFQPFTQVGAASAKKSRVRRR